jgi:outer membrane protein assembly factor BamE (lipoprotein component of BamABCDE complex)
MLRNLSVLAVSLFLMFTGAGCLVGVSNTDTQSGNYVAQSTIDQIEPNQTTKSWVADIVGQPTSKVKVDDQTEIWKYSYSEKHESSGAVFLIFGGSNTKETAHTLFIEFRGDVVSRKWVG